MHDGRDDHLDMRDIPGANGSPGHNGARNGRARLSPPPDEELDALAELFLGPESSGSECGAGPAPVTQAAGARRVCVEGLVLGHLPVLAGAWPSQYARHRAEEIGAPAVVVRLASGTLAIEILGPGADALAEAGTWREALGRAAEAAGLVLLRVDEPDEAELASMGRLDSLRLLTGADEAAVVGCYRKLKGMAAAAESAGVEMPPVALAVMGAPRERALSAHARIARASRAFLGAEMPEPVIVERIGPTRGATLFRGDGAVSIAELLAALDAGAPPARVEPRPEMATQAAPPACEPAAEQLIRPALADAPVVGGEGSLSTLAGGLRVLGSRCPLADRIELAADDAGDLHLVAGLLSGHPDRSSRRALRDLLACAAWAGQNRAILSKAEPRVRSDGPPAELHLVTDRPAVARALLGTPVRVHLAAPARPTALGLVSISLGR